MSVDEQRPPLARKAALVVLVASALAFVLLAALLVPWNWVPGGTLRPMPEHRLFTDAEIARAEHFATLRRVFGWSSYFLTLLLALVLGLTPAGAALARRLGGRLRWWLAVPVTTLVLLAAGRLLALPFGLAQRREDLRVGLTRQGPGGWASDQVKSLLVAWVITSLLLLAVVGFARWSSRFWFAWAGGAAMLLTVAGSFLYPVLVEPVFNHFTALPDGPLRSQILRLADRENVHVDDVLVADASRRTTTMNAYVSGFGSTRRVVVYDNLLRLPPAQVRVVVAHELGHARNRDVLLGTTLGAVGSVLGVTLLALLLDLPALLRRARVSGAADPAAVALVLALAGVGGFLASPVQNGVSRAIEARADRAALHATQEGAVFVRMQRRLALTSLADPTPPRLSQWWWGTHPTTLERAGLPASLRRAGR